MRISTQPDLILDAIRAADPQQAAAATRRLTELADAGQAFSTALAASARPPSAIRTPQVSASPSLPSVAAGRASTPLSVASPQDAYGALGGFVLKMAVEKGLPASNALTFGKGSAGAIWRSFLAEKLADAIAPAVFGRVATDRPQQVESAAT